MWSNLNKQCPSLFLSITVAVHSEFWPVFEICDSEEGSIGAETGICVRIEDSFLSISKRVVCLNFFPGFVRHHQVFGSTSSSRKISAGEPFSADLARNRAGITAELLRIKRSLGRIQLGRSVSPWWCLFEVARSRTSSLDASLCLQGTWAIKSGGKQ